MRGTIYYKSYTGSVGYSEEDGLFYGRVIGIRSLISYEGASEQELIRDFHEAVDDYLETCRSEGITPEDAGRCIESRLNSAGHGCAEV